MIDPMRSLHVLHEYGPRYAKAKAERIYIEESLRSVKAIEMKASDEQTAAAQEREAYASQVYRDQIAGLRAAVEAEETCRWKLIAAQAAIEVYRTMESSSRMMTKAAT